MKRIFLLILVGILGTLSSGVITSYLRSFESNSVKFKEVPQSGGPLVKLVATFPYEVEGWPLKWVSFSYSLDTGRHLIRTNLEYKPHKNGLISTVTYSQEYSEAVTLSTLSQDPKGNCGKKAVYSGSNPA
ncbi:hypothetical protein [Microbulbifer sp. PSTR4-B]|uniref:hypothetical protein n=1 Tax=Microbulbifer sp. PSTR4-B TaxID=3243396 RepID=UPI0040390324